MVDYLGSGSMAEVVAVVYMRVCVRVCTVLTMHPVLTIKIFLQQCCVMCQSRGKTCSLIDPDGET